MPRCGRARRGWKRTQELLISEPGPFKKSLGLRWIWEWEFFLAALSQCQENAKTLNSQQGPQKKLADLEPTATTPRYLSWRKKPHWETAHCSGEVAHRRGEVHPNSAGALGPAPQPCAREKG